MLKTGVSCKTPTGVPRVGYTPPDFLKPTLRLREVTSLAQGHRAGQPWTWPPVQVCLTPQGQGPCLFYTVRGLRRSLMHTGYFQKRAHSSRPSLLTSVTRPTPERSSAPASTLRYEASPATFSDPSPNIRYTLSHGSDFHLTTHSGLVPHQPH